MYKWVMIALLVGIVLCSATPVMAQEDAPRNQLPKALR